MKVMVGHGGHGGYVIEIDAGAMMTQLLYAV